MKKRCYQIVIDTNVWLSALRSKLGASYKLISLIDKGLFEINVSVPLVLEFEDVAKRSLPELELTAEDVDDILDYLCTVANKRRIYYLWRPYLSDPQDDMVLELAVTARCDFIISFNKKDFIGHEHFQIRVLTPKEFLLKLGVL